MTTYDDAMHRIMSQDDERESIAFKTLAWVNHAFRSLSLKELQHALAIEPGDIELDEEIMLDGWSITALCAGLITIDSTTDAVNFVHYTTYDYFEDRRRIHFPNFHGSITMSCATYLTMPALQNATIWTIVRLFPLACYAAQYLGDHARQNPEETLEQSILEAVYQLLADAEKRKPLLSLLDGLDLIRSGFYSVGDDTIAEESPVDDGAAGRLRPTNSAPSESKTTEMIEVTALHLAASMGLAKVASMLLKENPNIDAIDETGKTALTVAIEKGFGKAVEFLVNSGARVNLHEPHGQQVFLVLAEKRWQIATDIVAQRARASPATGDTNVSLLLAVYSGNIEEVATLLAHRPSEDIDQNIKELALFLAVERGDSEMVRTLLSWHVNVNSRDNIGQTSLHRATRGENERIMRILLEQGAEVDIMNYEWRTPWGANVTTKNERVLGVLLAAGANPSTRDQDGASVLYTAAANGYTDLVKFLLKSGTNPSLTTNFDWAPIHWAAYHGHLECVKLLIDAGAEVSPISDQGTTPLDLTYQSNQRAMSDLLLKNGAKEAREVNTKGSNESMDKTTEPDGSVNLIETAITLSLAEPNKLCHDTRMTLTFDRPLNQSLLLGQFIYPDHHHSRTWDVHDFFGERNQPYQLSHMLDTSATTISIRHSRTRALMSEYPLAPDQFDRKDALYDISHTTTDYQELELRGSSQASFPGVITMRRGWSGAWKAHHDHGGSTALLFRTTPEWSQSEDQVFRWTTEDGRLLARTGDEIEYKMRVERDLDLKLLDVVVACWVAKQWSDVQTRHKGESSAPQ